MNRYSTITFEIEAEFDLESMDDIWVTFKQGKNVITKKKSRAEVTADRNICYVTLSQEETATITALSPVAVQARWISGDVSDSSDIDYISLGDVLEEGVISV